MARMTRPLRFLPTLLVAASVALLAGCGSDPIDCDGCNGPTPDPEPSSSCLDEAPASGPTVVAGSSQGFGTFIEIEEGGALDQQFGGQGGTHVDVAALAFIDGAARVEFQVDGEWVASSEGYSDSCASGWHVVVGRVFDPPSGEALFRVTLTDDAGAELAVSEMNVVVQ